MHLATFFLALGALAWMTYGLRTAAGALRLPRTKDVSPATDTECPAISILFAARDEAEKLPRALATLVALDYPRLEIIAVDDRSRDETGRILDDFARAHGRLRVLHVWELPPRWLGKPHALQKGYEESTGEWLLFTDADVRFAPDVLRRAVALVNNRQWDHLTLLGHVEMAGFWESVAITFFGVGFHLAVDPDRVSDLRSSRYVGVGAFQILRRSAYEAAGTHRRLALEVVDDMKLGKIIKQAGYRSGVGVASESLTVRWHEGIAEIIRGVTKNFFASARFNLGIVAAQLAGLLVLDVLPFAALFFVHGWDRLFAAAACAVATGFHLGVSTAMGASPFYALTHPLGALIFCYMLLRSTVVTLWRGGIVWRDTFYPLEELKRGLV